MANLNETDDFPAGIYQLEDTDPVKGGAPNEATKAGVDNIPHQQLARRTRWLKTRVDTLVSTVVAATTAVAGIVRLTDSVTSTSTTTAATANAAKAANDNANLRAHKTTTIDTAGLATGGGDLSANRTITVTDASQAEAEAGTATNRAMSPLRVAQSVAARLTARSITAAGLATGGGDLSANRTITVTDASQAEAEAGTATNRAMSPLRVTQSIIARMAFRSVTGAGLATGGGSLDESRVITVPDASQAEAVAGTATNRAMSPLRVAQALNARQSAIGFLPDTAPPPFTTPSADGQGLLSWDWSNAHAPPAGAGGAMLKMLRSASRGVGAMIAVPAAGSVGQNSARLLVRATSGQDGDWGAWAEAWLGQQAAQSLGASGYQRLPSGLLIQWGQFTGTTSASFTNNGMFESDQISVTWPVAFTTLFQVIPGASADVTGYGQQEQVWRRSAGLTSGSFSVASRTSGVTMTGSYFVIGV